MNNRIYLFGGISLFLVTGAVAYYTYTITTQPNTSIVLPSIGIIATTSSKESPIPLAPTSSSTESMIIVTSPIPNTLIKSPLTISGEARGMWYFEGTFPIELRDSEGKTIATTSSATTTKEWMTKEFVPFNALLTWTNTTATSGVLILKRDNPSGVAENDSSVSIPVSFR